MGAFKKFFRLSPTPNPVGLTQQLTQLYADCGCNTPIVTLAQSDDTAINEGFEQLLNDLHSGVLKPEQISLPYYLATANKLMEAVTEGLGGDVFPADDIRNNLKAYFAENVFAFSAAKTLAMHQLFMGYLTDADGNLRSWAQFRNSVYDKATIYNMSHLQTEYNSAIAHSQMAVKWHTLQSFDKLEYSTVGDNRVRPAHRRFDGLVLSKDDPFWKTYWPPLDWNCRCTIIPAQSGAVNSSEERIQGATKPESPKDDIKPYFKGNAGIDKVIYKDNHPYRKAAPTELSAEKNYNLPSGKRIYDMNDLPTYQGLPDKESALKWWQTQTKGKDIFNLLSADGVTVTFDDSFKNKIIILKTDRHQYIQQLNDVTQNPDEVWANRLRKNTLQTTYVKYYNDYPIVIGVENGRAVTMHQLSDGNKIDFKTLTNKRQGELLYSK